MTSLKRNPWLGLCTLGAATLLAPSAFAQQECGDTTCDAGYECLTYDAPCPAIACAEGEDCDFACETEEVSYCERAECGSDADCGEYMICATQQRWDCPEVDASCDADGNCADVESVECTPTDYQVCTPPWELPCESASDCGDGFTCEAIEECACSGSEPAPADAPAKDEGADADGAAADEATERVAQADNCECKPGDVSYCQIVETACEADSDCPEHWTCADNPNGVCWADSEGNSGCETPDPAKLCNPPGYYTIAVRGGATDSGIAESGIAGTGVATSSDGEDLVGDPEATPAPAEQTDSESEDDGEASVTSIDEDDASNAPGDEDEDEVAITGDSEDEDGAPGGKPEDDGASDGKSSSVEEESGNASSSGGGCSVSARKGSGDAWSLLLIALGAALHRLRRRAA